MKTIGVATGGLGVLSLLTGATVPGFGVQASVILLSAFGSLCSYAYGKPEKSRKKMYTMAAVNTALATVCVALLPKWLGMEWVSASLEAPLGFAFAFMARFVIPGIIAAGPELGRMIFKLPAKAGAQEKANVAEDSPPTSSD
jgi:hypothetical protein